MKEQVWLLLAPSLKGGLPSDHADSRLERQAGAANHEAHVMTHQFQSQASGVASIQREHMGAKLHYWLTPGGTHGHLRHQRAFFSDPFHTRALHVTMAWTWTAGSAGEAVGIQQPLNSAMNPKLLQNKISLKSNNLKKRQVCLCLCPLSPERTASLRAGPRCPPQHGLSLQAL